MSLTFFHPTSDFHLKPLADEAKLRVYPVSSGYIYRRVYFIFSTPREGRWGGGEEPRGSAADFDSG